MEPRTVSDEVLGLCVTMDVGSGDQPSSNLDRMAEAEEQPAAIQKKKRPFYGKLPTKKKKYGHNARMGGNRKSTMSQVNPIVTAPVQTPMNRTGRLTKRQLEVHIAYVDRDKRNQQRKCEGLKRLVVIKNDQLELKDQQLKKKKDQLAAKSAECQIAATLAQERRRDSNAIHEACVTRSDTVEREAATRVKEALAISTTAQADAHSSILAERAYQSSMKSNIKTKHQKEIESLSSVHITQMTQQEECHKKEVLLRDEKYEECLRAIRSEHEKKMTADEFEHEEKMKADKEKASLSLVAVELKHSASIDSKNKELEVCMCTIMFQLT